MKLIELVSTLMEAGNPDINAKIVESEFFGVLMVRNNYESSVK